MRCSKCHNDLKECKCSFRARVKTKPSTSGKTKSAQNKDKGKKDSK